MYLAAALSTFRSVEENPEREIVREIFEPVFDARRDKQEIVRSKFSAFSATDEIAAPADDNVDFIARVWSLWIASARSVEFDG